MKIIHKVNGNSVTYSSVEFSHNVHLLNFIRICFCPSIIFSCCVISGINFRTCVAKFLRKFCSVTVTNSVCTPFIHNFKGFFNNIHICRNCYSAFAVCHFVSSVLFLYFYNFVVFQCHFSVHSFSYKRNARPYIKCIVCNISVRIACRCHCTA